jgi:hypothetical protein
MTLLNPIWLWALGGLTIPIAIHLLSRKEGKTIRVGSIRFLTETSTSKFSSIRLNEIVLLAVRSLLVVLIVLFLASLLSPAVKSKDSKKWVVVEKGLDDNAQIKKFLDSLQKDDYEIRRLSAGFSLLEDDTVTQSPDYYKLSEELSQQNSVQSVVLASNRLSNFKGKRIPLPDNIIWLSYPASSVENLPTDSVLYPDTVRIMLAYDQEFEYDRKIMRAALHALQDTAPAKIIIEETDVNKFTSSNSNWLIWLSTDDTRYTGKSLRFKKDVASDLIVQEGKNQWLLTKRLHEGNAVEQHVSVQLMSMLFNEEIRQGLRNQDKRIISDELVWSTDASATVTDIRKAGQSADKILILLIVLLFTAERIIAFYRNQ